MSTDSKPLDIIPLGKNRGEYRQPRSKLLDKLPTRSYILGSPQGGKTNLVSNLLTRLYPPFFRILYISPSARVDDSLQPLRDFVEAEQQKNGTKFRSFADGWNEKMVSDFLDEMEELTTEAKKQGMQFLPQAALVIDDLGEDPQVRRSKALKAVILRGRHNGVSLFYSGHYSLSLDPMQRSNMTCFYIFRASSILSLTHIADELSNIVSKDTFLAMVDKATSRPHGFLVVNLRATDPSLMFLNSLQSKMKGEDGI